MIPLDFFIGFFLEIRLFFENLKKSALRKIIPPPIIPHCIVLFESCDFNFQTVPILFSNSFWLLRNLRFEKKTYSIIEMNGSIRGRGRERRMEKGWSRFSGISKMFYNISTKHRNYCKQPIPLKRCQSQLCNIL